MSESKISLCEPCFKRLELDSDFSLDRSKLPLPMFISMCSVCKKITCHHEGTWTGPPARWYCDSCYDKLIISNKEVVPIPDQKYLFSLFNDVENKDRSSVLEHLAD